MGCGATQYADDVKNRTSMRTIEQHATQIMDQSGAFVTGSEAKTQDKKDQAAPNVFGALIKNLKAGNHTRNVSCDGAETKDLFYKGTLEEEIASLLVAHGIQSDQWSELAKKICELPSLNQNSKEVPSAPVPTITVTESPDKKISDALGGKAAFKKFSDQFAKAGLLDTLSSQLQEANKTKASQIIEKLQKIKLLVPESSVQELEWCIAQITKGEIYKDTNIVSIVEQLNAEKLDGIVPYISHYAGYKAKTQEKHDRQVSRRSDQRRRSSRIPAQKGQSLPFHRDETKEFIDVDSLDLDIFMLEVQNGQVGAYVLVASNVFSCYKFNEDFNINQDTLSKCIVNIGLGYHEKNPYHNALHAADVLQMSHLFLQQTPILTTAELEGIQIFGYLLSAIIHDLGHPGLTNDFMVAHKDALAIQYNDVSVLENYHVAEGFRIISQPENNVLANLGPEEFRSIRRIMIACVLGTDMSKHRKNVAMITSKFEQPHKDPTFILKTLLHAADISHSTRPFNVTLRWSIKVQSEFFQQGDQERARNMEISEICNREKLYFCKSQVGFISFLILPFYIQLAEKLPELKDMVTAIQRNKDTWQEKAESGEEIRIP